MTEQSYFSKFIEVLENDFDTYCPIPNQKKQELLDKSIALFNSKIYDIRTHEMHKIANTDFLKNQTYKNPLFMCRPLFNNCPLPHTIPHKYEIFYEKSYDLYTNYITTINNISGIDFDQSEITRCKSYIEKADKILCWSNSSIILELLLKNQEKYSCNILTYGSPIILPKYNSNSCINIYHEDDWILGFIGALYTLDISKIDKDVLYTFTINDNICNMIILSRNNFYGSECEPHRCFNYFF